MPNLDATAIRRQLFCKVRLERLAAVPLVAKLKDDEALPLLRRGTRHWDRELRCRCAKALIKRSGVIDAPRIYALARSKQLPIAFTVSFLSSVRTPAFVRSVTVKAAQRGADSFTLALAKKYKNEPAAKAVRAEIALRERKAFVIAERKREAERKKALAKAQQPSASKPQLQVAPSEAPLSEFATALGVELGLLNALYWGWARDKTAFKRMYTRFEIPKRHGGMREIRAPSGPLKALQRAILDKYLASEPLHPSCHGFREGHSTSTNALPHVGHEVVVNLDLRDFFPSITTRRVSGLFRSLELGLESPEVSFLVDATTLEGKLPQGSPASPVIANLVCRRLDSRLAGLATKARAVYTRYADDLTFSGPQSVLSVLPKVRKIISEEGFAVAGEKTRILRRGVRQDVTGLTVNSQVSVPRAVRRRLRAAVHSAKGGKPVQWKGQELSLVQLKGHLAYLRGVHSAEGVRLLSQLPTTTS